MSPALEFALLATLGLMACAASALAGALWWRLRSAPLVEVAQLARDLAERQRALERLVAKLEAPRGRRLLRPSPGLRWDRGQGGAEPAGPTLIAVPDMTSPPSKPSQVSADMGRRFGSIWALADRGSSSEEIAKATGQPVGQIELILGLRHPKGA